MRVCLFEDHGVAGLEPLTLTRPVFDLLCGCSSLADKHYRYFAATDRAVLVRPSLATVVKEQFPFAVNDPDWLKVGQSVMVNGRWLPPAPSLDVFEHPCVGLVDGEVAFAVVPADRLRDCAPGHIEECLEQWKSALPNRPAGGCLVRHLWDVVDHNSEQIGLDAWLSSPESPRRTGPMPAIVGPEDRLVIHPSAQFDPLVMADTRNGPVIIDRETSTAAFTRLEGPCYIGPGTQVHGAKVRGGTTLGPECRIGGEVECSIVQGYSNKYHDGFLGHAYVGSWVNLGAGTQNSDLRNDYGEVRVTVNGRVMATGRTKVGCYLGDHTKSGLAALINTGSNSGIFCNLLPTGGLLPKFVPSFTTVWNGKLVENVDLSLLMKTAEQVMKRRGQTLGDSQRALYARVLEETAGLRRQAIRESETRQLRKSA
jgi:UDP-N-acetylglucosamine diphosphorylase / glucose-1-phosphate thymidylyltransferase / UDP-N-acetylgalactosamine diphosphorylase / glucosamine-1-phosphate N-acetyltransferase / galactosamine-1-phosphate N-acetyltransferase